MLKDNENAIMYNLFTYSFCIFLVEGDILGVDVQNYVRTPMLW